MQSRAEIFLKLYRILEGELERRFSGRREGSSVIMEYIKDEDSAPFRRELNMCREIRNLLSHNADDEGAAVVEPSQSVLESLEAILEHVTSPKLALDWGTPCDRILWARSDNLVINVMHTMMKRGFSHVPIMENGHVIGVFSISSLFSFLERKGLGSIDNRAQIGQIADALNVERHGADRYCFMNAKATINQARHAFESRGERNSRLSAIFITDDGTPSGELLAMLTPWDLLKKSTGEGQT